MTLYQSLTISLRECRSPPKLKYLISAQTSNYDVFGLNESHIKVLDTLSFLNELTPEEFSLVHASRVNKCGGGVGVIIKTALDFKTIYSPEFSSFENQTVSLMLDGRHLFLVPFTSLLSHLF